MLVDTVRTLRHLPAPGVLTVCAFILVAAGARTGVWQRTRQQAAGAKRATNEWERTAFLLKDAAVNAVVFGLSTTVVIVRAHRWLIVLSLVMGAVLVVPTVLQDLRLTFGGALSIFSMRAQRTATAASIVMRLLGDLVQVFYVALLLTALVT